MIIAFREKEFLKFIVSLTWHSLECWIIIWYGTVMCENVSWNIEITSFVFIVLKSEALSVPERTSEEEKGSLERALWKARLIDKDREHKHFECFHGMVRERKVEIKDWVFEGLQFIERFYFLRNEMWESLRKFSFYDQELNKFFLNFHPSSCNQLSTLHFKMKTLPLTTTTLNIKLNSPTST